MKHYASLFKLPTKEKIIVFSAFACIGSGLISAATLNPSAAGFLKGFSVGLSSFLLTLASDYFAARFILKGEPIYDLRRTMALSLFCCVLWAIFNFFGAIISFKFGSSWLVKLGLLGFSAIISLRMIVFKATANINVKQFLAASLLQPISFIASFLLFWPETNHLTFLYLAFSLGVCLASSSFFTSLLNRVGKSTLGVSSLHLFRAFLLNWVADLNGPFEEYFERLGETRDVEVSILKFGSENPKVLIVVPSIHPGPFKNLGSSLLPSMIKENVEENLKCVVCVPHGLFGHEFDLASQAQTRRVVNQIVEASSFKVYGDRASSFVKVSNGLATACCQIFGDLAFLSFTFAPKTTEDLPEELGVFAQQEAKKLGLANCVIINAHNSIDGTISEQEALNSLKEVAADCLRKAVSISQQPFEVGSATIIPKEFAVEDGMGPGGITAVVVKVGSQKVVYIVLDGNNMVVGLREKILSALRSIGIDDGEVFTTDTHAVNAVTLTERGYHPLGEVISQEKLIDYVKNVTLTAISNMERARFGFCSLKISNVRVIGAELLEKLCLMVDQTIGMAKKIVMPIFAVSGAVLMLFLAFI